MNLSPEILHSINKSVLCWLATVDNAGQPNVSPKEIFTAFEKDDIIIANIASPQSVNNIKSNPKVCLSFVDILVQKGFQLKGEAAIITVKDCRFESMEEKLLKMTDGKYPFKEIIYFKLESSKPIIAPRYWMFPETTEAEQIKAAKAQYGL